MKSGKKRAAGCQPKRHKENIQDNRIITRYCKYCNKDCNFISEKLLDRLGEFQFERGYAASNMERFSPVVECGSISVATGRPRVVAVRGYYRSLPRRKIKEKTLPDKIFIVTKAPRLVNGFNTRLLEIDKQSFKLERRGIKRGVVHISGAFFALDRPNHQVAKQFFCEVSA